MQHGPSITPLKERQGIFSSPDPSRLWRPELRQLPAPAISPVRIPMMVEPGVPGIIADLPVCGPGTQVNGAWVCPADVFVLPPLVYSIPVSFAPPPPVPFIPEEWSSGLGWSRGSALLPSSAPSHEPKVETPTRPAPAPKRSGPRPKPKPVKPLVFKPLQLNPEPTKKRRGRPPKPKPPVGIPDPPDPPKPPEKKPCAKIPQVVRPPAQLKRHPRRVGLPHREPLPDVPLRAVNRSVPGCWTCKVRRKLCDRTKPGCNVCSHLGLVCDGYAAETPVYMHDATANRQRREYLAELVRVHREREATGPFGRPLK